MRGQPDPQHPFHHPEPKLFRQSGIDKESLTAIDILFMAERCRRLLRKTDAPAIEVRRFPFRRRSAGGHQPLRQGPQPRTKAIHLESRPQRDHCSSQAWAPNVGINPLAGPTACSQSGFPACHTRTRLAR